MALVMATVSVVPGIVFILLICLLDMDCFGFEKTRTGKINRETTCSTSVYSRGDSVHFGRCGKCCLPLIQHIRSSESP